MRVVGKFNGHAIRLDSLHMSETYGGFLLGPSEKRIGKSTLETSCIRKKGTTLMETAGVETFFKLFEFDQFRDGRRP